MQAVKTLEKPTTIKWDQVPRRTVSWRGMTSGVRRPDCCWCSAPTQRQRRPDGQRWRVTRLALSRVEGSAAWWLRAPTVTHHLNILRLAGLVQLTIGMGTGKETKHYAARREAVPAAFASLQGFLEKGQGEHTEG